MFLFFVVTLLGASAGVIIPASAQTPPRSVEVAHQGLYAALARGADDELRHLLPFEL